MRRDRQPDSGVTLAEVLVSAVIGGLILLMLAAVFMTSLNKSVSATTRTTTTADSRNAMEYMTRLLRVAVPPASEQSAFVAAAADDVKFYSSDNTPGNEGQNIPTLVEFDVDTASHCLVVRRWDGVLANGVDTWPTLTSSACIASGTFAAGIPLFSYYSSGTSTTPIGAEPVPSDQLSRIFSVGINIDLSGAPSRGAPATVMSSRVSLLNVCNPDNLAVGVASCG